ncbi:hypothetical protein [Lacinutrix chionoecetis]
MKQIVSLLIVLFSVFSFSQENKKEKVYEFDYFLEYSEKGGECYTNDCKHFKLVNSKDNSYQLVLYPSGKDSLGIFFKDFSKYYAKGILLSTDLLKEDTLDFKCGYNKIIRDNLVTEIRMKDWKYKYNYLKIKDTVINSNLGVIYSAINKNKLERKNKKNKKLNLKRYIVIEENSDFNTVHFNNFFDREQWERSNVNFGGVIKYKFIKRHNVDHQDWEITLEKISPFKKVLKLKIDCD